MANVTTNIPDNLLPRVQAAFTNYVGGFAESGLTANQWVKKCIADYVKQTVRHYEAGIAAQTQGATSDSEVNIT